MADEQVVERALRLLGDVVEVSRDEAASVCARVGRGCVVCCRLCLSAIE